MTTPPLLRGPGSGRRDGPSIADRATGDLALIRATLERSSRFTAVPGREAMGMGVVALAAAITAANAPPHAWLATWLVAAVLAVCVGAYGLQRKSRALGTSLFAAPGRRFLLGLCPPLIAGSILTGVLASSGHHEHLAGTWLLLYGAGVTSGGTYSVPVVPLTGATFLALGALAFLAPAGSGNLIMALGFGGLHLVFGYVVVRRHGG